MAQRYQFVVDFRPDAVATDEGVDLESEVEGGASCWHRLDFTLGREHENLACEEVELDGIEKVHRVGPLILWNYGTKNIP